MDQDVPYAPWWRSGNMWLDQQWRARRSEDTVCRGCGGRTMAAGEEPSAGKEDAVIQYPLMLSFKVIAFNPQVRVTDATGRVVAYGKQKALKFKEDITIFADEEQQRPLFRVHADRVIDWGARYSILDASGAHAGALQREGARSLWRATYHILDRHDANIGVIHEESGWTKMGDGLLSEIPVVGLLAGYLFNPAYLVDVRGETVFYLKKQPAFLEGSFRVEQRKEVTPDEGPLLLAGTLLAVMLERWRG
jgi:hypothetical protein